jgi:hypothetical protein
MGKCTKYDKNRYLVEILKIKITRNLFSRGQNGPSQIQHGATIFKITFLLASKISNFIIQELPLV